MLPPRVSDAVYSGRLLISLSVNGVACDCFIDSGSEVTLIKNSCKDKFKINKVRPHFHSLQGASGQPFRTTEDADLLFYILPEIKCKHRVILAPNDVSFPGEMMLGVDFLRRFNFRLSLYHSPLRNYATFNGIVFKMKYSDHASLGLNMMPLSPPPLRYEDGMVVYCSRTVVVPPRSGCFIRGNVPEEVTADCLRIVTNNNAVLIPHSIVSVNKGHVSVWVMNDRNTNVILLQGNTIAHGELVSDVFLSPGRNA